jgi:hypothetical protein
MRFARRLRETVSWVAFPKTGYAYCSRPGAGVNGLRISCSGLRVQAALTALDEVRV